MGVYTLDEKLKRNASEPLVLSIPSPTPAIPPQPSDHPSSSSSFLAPRRFPSPAPGRLIAAFGAFYVCTKTPHGTSLHALLGLFLALGGALNACAVGLGDGNAVDLEDKERRRVAFLAKERREQAAKQGKEKVE